MDWSKYPALRPPLQPGAWLERRTSPCHAGFGRTDLTGNREGYLYLVRFADFVKLGFSADPAKRIAAIAAALPGDLEVIWIERGRLHDERRFHRALEAFRVKGEWYRCEAIAELGDRR